MSYTPNHNITIIGLAFNKYVNSTISKDKKRDTFVLLKQNQTDKVFVIQFNNEFQKEGS